ncbi:MAG TPA: serine/threonine-protein kinase [Gemmatimonadales bacterium]|nr:serine/threonine-protein kinase [Gemmatimonadales bacterium]
MKNRRCPRCHAHYAPPARYCTRDGTPLVEVAAAPAGAPAEPGLPADAEAPAQPSAQRPGTDRIAPPSLAAREAIYSSLSGQILDQRYAITKRLGEGGMAYVYLATELESGRAVAVKVLTPRLSRDPASVERLRREASIAMRLDHPNVCPILRIGETADGLMYLVMPFLEGEALSDVENRKGPFAVADGIPLLIQMCRGLQHAHELQIVHRDLKPENVMLVPDSAQPGGYRAVVMDFGLAKERRAGPEVVKLTATGIVLGTPEFMSPEQIRGKPLDGRSDVYALGVLAFEMFTGQLPFGGKSAQESMLARLKGEPLKLRAARADLPPKLEAVIARALQIRAEDRYASMSDLADALTGAGSTGVFARLFGK